MHFRSDPVWQATKVPHFHWSSILSHENCILERVKKSSLWTICSWFIMPAVCVFVWLNVFFVQCRGAISVVCQNTFLVGACVRVFPSMVPFNRIPSQPCAFVLLQAGIETKSSLNLSETQKPWIPNIGMCENEVVPNLAFLSICSKPNFTVWCWFLTGHQLGSTDSSLPGWVFSAGILKLWWTLDRRLEERSEKQCDLWVIFVDRNVDEFCIGGERSPSTNLPRHQFTWGSPERPRLGFHRLVLGAFFATPAVTALDLCDLDQKTLRWFLDVLVGAVAPFCRGWWKILIWWKWKLQIDCFPSNWTAGFKG